MTRHLPLLLVLGGLVVGAVVGCGPSEEPSPPEEPVSLERLWRDRTPVEEHGRAAGPGPGEIVFEDDFDGTAERPWFGTRSMDEYLVHRELRPGGGLLRLDVRSGWYVVMPIAARPGEALSVGVRLRPAEPDADAQEMSVAAVVELRDPFDPDEPLTPEDMNERFDSRRYAHCILSGPVGDATLDLRQHFVTSPNTRWLALYLLAPKQHPERPLIFERVEVRRHTLADHVAAGGELSDVRRLEEGSTPSAVRVTLDREERGGLLALPPSRFVWELPPFAGERRLELSLGVSPRDGAIDGAVRFRVEATGVVKPDPTASADDAAEAAPELVLDELRRAPAGLEDASWNDRSVVLPASPDGPQRVVLSTEAVGPNPPLAVFGHPTVHTPLGDERPNVLIVSIDTLRPDRLGCYGGDGTLSPTLDALAAEGLRYAEAYSTTTYTLPSHGSLMTGQFPAFHGAVDVTDALDGDHSPILARMLADAGYVTAAFTGGGYVSTAYGFGQGFDRYSHNDPVWARETVRGRQLMQTASWERLPVTAELLRRYDVRAVERWIAERAGGSPFFLFLHTYVVHNYAPDEAWLERQGLLGEDGAQAPFNHKERERFNEGELELRERVFRQYMPYYDATIGMADEFMQRVLAALEAAGLDENTMVVVLSDHGEEFGEHDFFGHGETTYDASARIPMIVRLPGPAEARQGEVVTEPVSLVDVAPWVLSVVGLDPDPRMSIEPPLGPDRFAPPSRSMLMVELDNHRYRTSAVRRGSLKLHVRMGRDGRDFDAEELELYDVAADPGETRDLLAERATDRAALRGLLTRFHELADAVRPRRGGPVDLSTLPPDILHQLKALGYLDAGDVDAALGGARGGEGSR